MDYCEMDYTSDSGDSESEDAADISRNRSESESEHVENIGKQKCDGRSEEKLHFTVKWELKYAWAYYSSAKGGWLCKTCEEYSDSHDEHWKTIPRKHDQHPGLFFREHLSCQKHSRAMTNKRDVKMILVRGNIVRQINKGVETKTVKVRERNRRLIKKFIKIIYFLAKKKWAVKNNFEEVLKFIADIGDEDICLHLNNAPGNSTYTSTSSAEQFLKTIGDYLNERIITDILASGDFTILADESTDEGDRSQMSVFARFVEVSENKPVERFLGMVKLTTSKKAIYLHETILNLLQSKHLDKTFIRFSGLDGTNAMSGERKGLQRLLRHTAPHAQYLNCRNHRLALCLVHLMSRHKKLLELDGLLISLWKTFKYSTIKQAIFEEAQVTHDLKPVKILKACVTRWLTHGESCIRIISRFEPLVDALDTIFFQRGDAEAKGVRDQLLQPDVLCMLLLLAEVLAPINNLSKYLQTSTLLYCSVSIKVERLLARLRRIKDDLVNHDSTDSILKYFNKALPFLQISANRNDLGRNLRGRDMANQHDPHELIRKFLAHTGYSFMDNLIAEIDEALTDNNKLLEAFNVFNTESGPEHRRSEHLDILCDHYGVEITDVYQGDATRAESVISSIEQKVERNDFFEEFDDMIIRLNEEVKKEARRKMSRGELKQSEMCEFVNSNRPSPSNVYTAMSNDGCARRFPNTMQLFKLALLIPPTTSGVERGFSVMNLLVSPMRATLNEQNVDRLMRICLDGPETFSDKQLEDLVNKFKDTERILL